MRIYVHGNCQSQAMARMLREHDETLSVQAREVHVIDLANEMEGYETNIRQADLILAQPVNETYRNEPRLSTSWIRQNKRAGATLLTVLPLYFTAYLPSQGYLANVKALNMPYHDYHLVDYYAAGHGEARMIADTADQDFFTERFLTSEAAASLQASYHRERTFAPDIKVTSWIERRFREDLLFYTFNHPTRAMLAQVLNEVARLAGLKGTIAATGQDYLDLMAISPYRSVEAKLRVSAGPLHDKVRSSGETFDRPQYIRLLVHYYNRTIGREKAAAAIEENASAKTYLARFKADGSGLTAS